MNKYLFIAITASRLILAATSLSLLISCSETPKDPIRIASSPWPGYEPLYLAREIGYFKNQNIKLFELPSSDITMEAFRNQSTDLATLTLDETLELLHDGTKLRILLTLDISHGGDAVLAHPDIKSLSDIKGKRIAIVNIPLGLYMLNRLLETAGVNRSDVTVFPMSETKQEQFYKDGKADVVITFEPVKTKLKELGAHVIFDSSMIPDEIFDLLVVHEETYLQRKEELCSISKTWFKTLNYMQSNSLDAAQKITQRLDVDINDYDSLLDGIILATVDINRKLLGGTKPGIIEPASRLSSIMINEKQLSRPVDISSAIDADFARCFSE